MTTSLAPTDLVDVRDSAAPRAIREVAADTGRAVLVALLLFIQRHPIRTLSAVVKTTLFIALLAVALHITAELVPVISGLESTISGAVGDAKSALSGD
jgi:hypothetical protein